MAKQNQNSKEKEKKARQANAAKQKRYRESMKAKGYRARLIWEKPLDTGWVRAAAPVIRKGSLGIAKSNPAIGEIVNNIYGTFIFDCGKKKIPKSIWEPVLKDMQVLLKPILGK